MIQPSLFGSDEATHIYISLLEYTHVHTDKSSVVKNYVLLELYYRLQINGVFLKKTVGT
jgi:hypothetical protein